MNYNFELSRFLDDLRKRHRITYEAYVTYRSMADILAMENDRFEKLEDKIKSGELCDRKETAREILDWMETVWRSNGGCFQKYMFESMRKEYGLDDEE